MEQLPDAQQLREVGLAERAQLRLAEQTGRRAYARAIAMLKRARRAASAAGQDRWFSDQLVNLREQHRRPALIEMLDKAKLP